MHLASDPLGVASVIVKLLSEGSKAYLVRYRTADAKQRSKQFRLRRDALAFPNVTEKRFAPLLRVRECRASVPLVARAETDHVIWIAREHERTQTLRHDGEVGVDDVECSGGTQATTDRHRLIERVDLELTDHTSQVCLPSGVSPDL